MKFQANTVECWRKNDLETVFFGNEEKELALTMSNVPGSEEHYVEWNDQSNACYNGVKKVQLTRDSLEVELLPDAATQLGEASFTVDFECDKATFEAVSACLKVIFQKKLLVRETMTEEKPKPKKDYSTLQYLNLEGKRLKQLPDYVAEMRALETAILTHNPQLDLQEAFAVLAGCPHLKELSFSLESGDIPENIGQLTQIETLTIDGLIGPCTLPESIGQLKKLTSLLILSDADVTLPESFADLTALTDLNLRVAGWNMPARFYQLTKLTTLDFANCRIAHFPAEIAHMPGVDTVVFQNTQVDDYERVLSIVAQMPRVQRLELNMPHVPAAVGLCKNITELVVWAGDDPENPVQLPDELFDLSQLETLLLNFNYFDKIPEGLGRLKGLKTLVLKESVFEALPHSIGALTNLEFLNLSENPALKSLPESLGNLLALKHLHLEYLPQLMELPASLQHLKNLESVRLSNPDAVKNVPENWKSLLE